jgi:hypothetical protein
VIVDETHSSFGAQPFMRLEILNVNAQIAIIQNADSLPAATLLFEMAELLT